MPPTSNPSINAEELFGVIAALNAEDSVPKVDLSSLQLQDPDLVEVIFYLQRGDLPEDSQKARELALSKL